MPTEYKVADDEVIDVMREVMRKHEWFRDLIERDVRVEVLFAWADNNQPVKCHGVPALAAIKVVGAEERATGGPDLRIKVDAKRYEALSPTSRQALFAHELYHAEVQFDDAGHVKLDAYRRPVIKLIPDHWSINGFRPLVDWYGENSVEMISYRRVSEMLAQRSFGFVSKPELKPTPEPETKPESVAEDAIQALVSFGYTEEAAQEAVYASDPSFRRGVAEGEAWCASRRDEAEADAATATAAAGKLWRSSPLTALAPYGLHLSEAAMKSLADARIDSVGALFDLVEDGELDSVDLSEDEVDLVLVVKRSFLALLVEGPDPDNWRSFDLVRLPLANLTETAIARLREARIHSLGDLAAMFDESSYSDLGLANQWKVTTGVVVKLREALDDFRNGAAPRDPELKRPPAPKPRDPKPVEAPGVDGLFLVFAGRQKSPVYAVRAPSKLEAIYYVKSQHPADARLRVEPDDGTASRLGLPVMAAGEKSPEGVCSHCKGDPKVICPLCGKLSASETAEPKPRKPRKSRTKESPVEESL